MAKNLPTIFYVFITFVVLFYANTVFAKTDLSVTDSDITFSKAEPFSGDIVRIYARVNNNGDSDVSGSVIFTDNGVEISGLLPVSVRIGSYDDVFIDWTAKKGTHEIKAKVIETNPADEITENNTAIKKDVFVDLDTDKDGIGDSKDDDVDGDGISNADEVKNGTNPLVADTDGDGVNDKVDAFAKDKTEWRDTDNDGIGDNKDTDDDGDGLLNQDEIQKYGTNPLNADTDNDGVSDKKEIDAGTNPLKADASTALGAGQWQASMLGSLRDILKGNEQMVYWILGIFAFIIILLLFRKPRTKRRR